MTAATPVSPLKRPRTCSCEECGTVFVQRHVNQAFCSTACKNTLHNRAMYRGRSVMTLALAWRGAKSKRADPVGKRAFAELCRELDRYNAEDRAAGRRSAYEVLARQLRHSERDR